LQSLKITASFFVSKFHQNISAWNRLCKSLL